MFKLTHTELDAALEAINFHGYSTLLPTPMEWQIANANWEEIRQRISEIDLDTYRPHVPMRIYAPKNRFNVRAVTLLHPQDLIIYTGLVLIVRDDIEDAREPVSKKTVFSYRSSPTIGTKLYKLENAFTRYRERLQQRVNLVRSRYVAIADIADYYPRIYQHRLQNIIEAAATCARAEEVARVLGKMLSNLAGGASYGIPIGPFASRVLGEAVLIDVDAALASKGFNFVRWVDDFNIFSASEHEAQYALFFLAGWLFDKHGLTLQSTKTIIQSADDFSTKIENTYESRLRERSEVLLRIWSDLDPYSDEDEEISEDDIAEIEGINLHQLLEESFRNADNIDYEFAAFILGRIATLQALNDQKRSELVNVVLENTNHLYPIADRVAKFFLSFDEIEANEKRRIARALLKPIKTPPKNIPPPDYYVMWILSIFASSPDWNQANDLSKIYQNAESEVVRRYAACALAATGTRSHALIVQPDFDRASPLLRLAILLCSKKLGNDERSHWKRRKVISDALEKKI